MKKSILLLLAVILSVTLYSQKEANYWFFGNHAGLDFSHGLPMPITNSQINTMEGCSSISSSNGQLRFYTDGMTIWDRNGNVMPNGTGMAGHNSSTQSGVVVPTPGNPNKYFVFSVDASPDTQGNGQGLRYSVVDMTLNGGMGDVTAEKNILLIPNQIEKITAVGNFVGDGTWVLSHKWGTNEIWAFLITSFGINTTPYISYVGDLIPQGTGESGKGYMKVSPDGTKICTAHSGANKVQIFDFNNSTGFASNAIIDNNYTQLPYGVEFSPDNKVLYVGTWKQNGPFHIYQYDLTAGSPQGILNSRLDIANVNNLGALQLGPDNRIYVATRNQAQVAVINKPNTYGIGCNFQMNGPTLAGHTCQLGLPPFITSFFNLNVNFYYEPACFGELTRFFESSSATPDSVLWNFNDPASGNNNWSKLFNPTHLFTGYGFYGVKLKAYIAGKADSVTHIVVVGEIPQIDLGVDTSFCTGDTLILDAGANFLEYFWQYPDSLGRYFPVDTSGTYWVQVKNMQGCSGFDTITVTVNPKFYDYYEESICETDSVKIGEHYYNQPGIYWDSLLTMNGCDSVFEVQLFVRDTNEYHESFTICDGDSVLIGGVWRKNNGTFINTYTNYVGCDSSVTSDLFVTDIHYSFSEDAICDGDSIFLCQAYRKTAGVYYDTTISTGGCDSIHEALLNTIPITNTNLEASICDNEFYFVGGANQTEPGIYYDTLKSVDLCDSILTTQLFVNPTFITDIDTMICEGTTIYAGGGQQGYPGVYVDQLQSLFGCDSVVTTVLSIDSLPRPYLGHDTTIHESSTLLLSVSFPGYSYQWQDGSTDSAFLVTTEGSYYVIVTSNCGSGYDTINVNMTYDECIPVAPNAFSPNGDGLNDEFKIIGYCDYGEYSLQVFDRWGKLVFESTELGEGWNGTVDGKEAPIGTYVWMVKYREEWFLDLEEITMHGTVNLIR